MNIRLFDIEGHTIGAFSLNPHTTGAPIILLHSILASPRQWLQDPVFRQREGCYALSLPGHYPGSFSPQFRNEQLTPELIARLLNAVIRQISDQPVTLVGFSTGAFAALAIAAHMPALVRRVVSISGFVQGRWGGTLGKLQRLARGRMLSQITFYACVRAYNRQLDPRAMLAYCQVLPDADIQELLPQITAPTLVLAGERDTIVSPEQSRLIAQAIPEAKLVIIPRAGHKLFGEPDYQQATQDWLRLRSGGV
jgi:pimeloyl-ACP methyl ester carboxylesterase